MTSSDDRLILDQTSRQMIGSAVPCTFTLVAVQLVAVISAIAVIHYVGFWNGPVRRPWYPLVMGLLLSQGNLLGFWAALGGRLSPWRVAGMTVFVVLLAHLFESCFHQRVIGYTTIAFVLQPLVTAIVSLTLRMFGMTVQRGGRNAAKHDNEQLSYTTLLSWLAGLVIVVAAVRLLPYTAAMAVGNVYSVFLLVLECSANFIVALAALWVALGKTQPTLRCAVLGVSCLFALVSYTEIYEEFHDVSAGLIVCYALLTAGYLAGFRAMDYRLTWSPAVRRLPLRRST